jgi:hypothetical protein
MENYLMHVRGPIPQISELGTPILMTENARLAALQCTGFFTISEFQVQIHRICYNSSRKFEECGKNPGNINDRAALPRIGRINDFSLTPQLRFVREDQFGIASIISHNNLTL